jgi:tripartite-type tricarboxylate transporter receptor subunit TctC
MYRPLTILLLLSCGWNAGCAPDGQSTGSSSSGYPSRSATVICPWNPGGGTDSVARFWAAALEREFDSPFVVVNKTGGSGAVGHTEGARARPDGHTLTVITFELCTMHRIGITPITYEDYECLLQFNADPAAIIVQADAPWQTLEEFLTDIQSRGDNKLKLSGTAIGGAWDLARVGLMQAAGVAPDSIIWVPTEGSAPSLVELLGGHIDAVCCSVPEAAVQVDAGQLRVLAVMSEDRLPDYPDVPTALESGHDWVAVAWRGLALPRNTPAPVVELLKEKCLAIANSPEYQDFMAKFHFGIKIRATEEFKEFLRQQDEQWKTVIESAGYAKS